MMYAYGGENNIPEKLFKGNLTHEYASMLSQNKLKTLGETEITIDIAKECIKQAICFQVLKRSADIKELTPEIAADLHTKASILSEHITKENMHVLKNKELMIEASIAIQPIQCQPEKNAPQIDSVNFERLTKLEQKDIAIEEINKEQEVKHDIEKSKGFEVGI